MEKVHDVKEFRCHTLSSVPSWSCSKAVYKPAWHIPLLSVQWINSWWWTEELSETCRVSWQNKFVKLVHLFGFIIKKFVTMHSHMIVKKVNMVFEAYHVTLCMYSRCSYLNMSESFVCYKHSWMKNRICQVVLHKITFDLWRNRTAFPSVCIQKQARSLRTVTAELQL